MATKTETALLKKAQEILEEENEAGAEEQAARRIIEEAQERRKKAHESLQKVLAPMQEQRDELVAKRKSVEAELQRNRVKGKKLRGDLESIAKEITEIESKVENMGIPKILLGNSRTTAKSPRQEAPENGVWAGRTQLKPYMLGEFPTLLVSAPIEGEDNQRATFAVAGDGVTFLAERLVGNAIPKKPQLSTKTARMSDIATLGSGWVSSKDLAWGIVSALGMEDKFPAIQAKNPKLVKATTHKG